MPPPKLTSHLHTYTYTYKPVLSTLVASLAIFCLHAFTQVMCGARTAMGVQAEGLGYEKGDT